MTMKTRNWTYVKMMLPNVEALDLSVAALEASSEFALQRGRHPWFFLRYVDFYGPQLRLRLLADPPDRVPFIEWARQFYGDFTSHLAESNMLNSQGPVPGRIGFDVAPYRPETVKYGTSDGVAVVEDLWGEQCETVLETWATPSNKSARISLFATVAKDVLSVAEADENRAAVLRTHAWYWLRTMDPKRPALQAFMNQVQAEVTRLDQGLRVSARISLAAQLDRALGRLQELPGARSGAHYNFNLLHILANRLGLAPMEEGLVMLALADMEAIPARQVVAV